MYSVFEKKRKRKNWSNILRNKKIFTKFAVLVCLITAGLQGAERNASVNSFREEIFEEQMKYLKYLDESNPRVLILFSGTPGMGKTTLAKRLEDYFHGVRINLDLLRKMMSEHGFRYEDPLLQYLRWSMLKLLAETSNHLIILDSSVDRKYEICQTLAKEHGFEIYLIRLEVEREEVEKRIVSRGTDVENLLLNMDGYWRDYEKFGETVEADFYLDNGSESNETLSELIENLTEKMASLGECEAEKMLQFER